MSELPTFCRGGGEHRRSRDLQSAAAQVRAAIENSADDLGRVGTVPFYERGRVNIARASNVQ